MQQPCSSRSQIGSVPVRYGIYPTCAHVAPNASGADTESKDPGLKEHEAGWMRGDAKVTGVTISIVSAR
jgi:hypothetical protein